jgi:hypothetical protein
MLSQIFISQYSSQLFQSNPLFFQKKNNDGHREKVKGIWLGMAKEVGVDGSGQRVAWGLGWGLGGVEDGRKEVGCSEIERERIW